MREKSLALLWLERIISGETMRKILPFPPPPPFFSHRPRLKEKPREKLDCCFSHSSGRDSVENVRFFPFPPPPVYQGTWSCGTYLRSVFFPPQVHIMCKCQKRGGFHQIKNWTVNKTFLISNFRHWQEEILWKIYYIKEQLNGNSLEF